MFGSIHRRITHANTWQRGIDVPINMLPLKVLVEVMLSINNHSVLLLSKRSEKHPNSAAGLISEDVRRNPRSSQRVDLTPQHTALKRTCVISSSVSRLFLRKNQLRGRRALPSGVQ